MQNYLCSFGKEHCGDGAIVCTGHILENPILALSVLSILRG